MEPRIWTVLLACLLAGLVPRIASQTVCDWARVSTGTSRCQNLTMEVMLAADNLGCKEVGAQVEACATTAIVNCGDPQLMEALRFYMEPVKVKEAFKNLCPKITDLHTAAICLLSVDQELVWCHTDLYKNHPLSANATYQEQRCRDIAIQINCYQEQQPICSRTAVYVRFLTELWLPDNCNISDYKTHTQVDTTCTKRVDDILRDTVLCEHKAMSIGNSTDSSEAACTAIGDETVACLTQALGGCQDPTTVDYIKLYMDESRTRDAFQYVCPIVDDFQISFHCLATQLFEVQQCVVNKETALGGQYSLCRAVAFQIECLRAHQSVCPQTDVYIEFLKRMFVATSCNISEHMSGEVTPLPCNRGTIDTRIRVCQNLANGAFATYDSQKCNNLGAHAIACANKLHEDCTDPQLQQTVRDYANPAQIKKAFDYVCVHLYDLVTAANCVTLNLYSITQCITYSSKPVASDNEEQALCRELSVRLTCYERNTRECPHMDVYLTFLRLMGVPNGCDTDYYARQNIIVGGKDAASAPQMAVLTLLSGLCIFITLFR